MRRRTALGIVSVLVASATGQFSAAVATEIGEETLLERAIEALPFKHFAVAGGKPAFELWHELRQQGRGWPIIVGGDKELIELAETFFNPNSDTPQAILDRAARLKHPESLLEMRAKEGTESAKWLEDFKKSQGAKPPDIAVFAGPDHKELGEQDAREWMESALREGEPPIGSWPEEPVSYGLSLVFDADGKPLSRVHILLIPVNDGAEVPAYLRWGNWNSCPPPEYHVAALKSWSTRYGAELVGMSGDLMIPIVTRRPASRDEAIALAREQYFYCEDIVLQDYGTLAPLAARLMDSDWWYFWWD